MRFVRFVAAIEKFQTGGRDPAGVQGFFHFRANPGGGQGVVFSHTEKRVHAAVAGNWGFAVVTMEIRNFVSSDRYLVFNSFNMAGL